jgi:hypothetical protein
MPKYNLLSQGSTKIEKSNKLSDEWFSRIMYLAPHNLADGKRTLCPFSIKANCYEACLNTSGHGKFSNVQQSRIRKSLLFLNDQDEFMQQLVQDVHTFLRECKRKGKKPALRLNGTSDIQWENIPIKNNNYEISNMYLLRKYSKYFEGYGHSQWKPCKELVNLGWQEANNIFELFPQIQFYDYTKIPTRKVEHIPNYHLTWSYSEADSKYAALIKTVSNNIAVVFREALPEVFKGFKVIDGDKHDMRFLDETQVVVGLIEKGEAKKDTSGFVIDLIKARAI